MGVNVAVAVDGGNSKTDLAVVNSAGAVLARARGEGFRPQVAGVPAAMKVLDDLLGQVGFGAFGHVAAFLAGADLPEEEAALQDAVAARGWAPSVRVANDTFALLRAGTARPYGVAVVCGTGINCVGVAADGRTTRFPALGAISGDWGGGADVGREALWHAVRGEDGRGPRTALERVISEHFGLPTVAAVVTSLHYGELPATRLRELAPAVLATADPVAWGIVDRLADEVLAMAVVALRRLDLLGEPCEVVLGGGVLASRQARLFARIEDGLARAAPAAEPVLVTAPPLLGAALSALDHFAATAEARDRLRSELSG